MRQGGEPSPGADVGAVSPVPVQISAGEPSPGADVGGVSPVPEKSRLACYRLLRTCFALGRRRSAEAAQRAVGLKDPVPVQMWAGVGSVLVQMWQGWASPSADSRGGGAGKIESGARGACELQHIISCCNGLFKTRCPTVSQQHKRHLLRA
jgi:hypothetical protein